MTRQLHVWIREGEKNGLYKDLIIWERSKIDEPDEYYVMHTSRLFLHCEPEQRTAQVIRGIT